MTNLSILIGMILDNIVELKQKNYLLIIIISKMEEVIIRAIKNNNYMLLR